MKVIESMVPSFSILLEKPNFATEPEIAITNHLLQNLNHSEESKVRSHL